MQGNQSSTTMTASISGPEGRYTGLFARVVTRSPTGILRPVSLRRGGRVAEGARLESVYTGNRIVGSNPTPSAISVSCAGKAVGISKPRFMPLLAFFFDGTKSK